MPVLEYNQLHSLSFAGMMCFMTYFLIKNPETKRKLRTEIDEVLGGQPVQYQDLSKMVYLNGSSLALDGIPPHADSLKLRQR